MVYHAEQYGQKHLKKEIHNLNMGINYISM